MTDPVVETVSIRERVKRIRSECEGVWAQYGVSMWERGFFDSIETRSTEKALLTPRQEETLAEIERKAFG